MINNIKRFGIGALSATAAGSLPTVTSTNTNRNLVVNGRVAQEGEYPQAVAITEGDHKPYCSGTAIATWPDQTDNSTLAAILTAKHCLTSVGFDRPPPNIQNASIALGTVEVLDPESQPGKWADNIHDHTTYPGGLFGPDIGLVLAQMPGELGRDSIAKLAKQPPEVGDTVLHQGYGRGSYPDDPDDPNVRSRSALNVGNSTMRGSCDEFMEQRCDDTDSSSATDPVCEDHESFCEATESSQYILTYGEKSRIHSGDSGGGMYSTNKELFAVNAATHIDDDNIHFATELNPQVLSWIKEAACLREGKDNKLERQVDMGCEDRAFKEVVLPDPTNAPETPPPSASGSRLTPGHTTGAVVAIAAGVALALN